MRRCLRLAADCHGACSCRSDRGCALCTFEHKYHHHRSFRNWAGGWWGWGGAVVLRKVTPCRPVPGTRFLRQRRYFSSLAKTPAF